MRPAYFFDRDGTLNENIGYLHRWDQFKWCPGAIGAIQVLNKAGILVVVVTNQAGVAHGYYTEEAIKELHQSMNTDLSRHRAHIDAFYYCPHNPRGSVPRYVMHCNCRKPKPGMLLRAIADLGIDPVQSVMIGDKEIDLQAGSAAGVSSLKLVDKHQDRYALVNFLVHRQQSGSPRNPLQPAM